MEHSLNVPAHCDSILPEAEEDTEKGGAEGWSREEVTVEALFPYLKATVEHNPLFPVVCNFVVGQVPRLSSLLCFDFADLLDVSGSHKFLDLFPVDGGLSGVSREPLFCVPQVIMYYSAWNS